MEQVFDIAIIGGGINGCGCAADAAERGLSVVLFEQEDIASKTSSSSTKLIHGGLRYLEHYEFSLVKKALHERQTLLNLAPHIVHPQSFILPYQKHMRPAWLLRLGLFFYDHLSKKNHLPKCRSIRRSTKNSYFNPLDKELNRGFLFYDAATDDARLTLLNALQAKQYGAEIHTYTQVIDIKEDKGFWKIQSQNNKGECVFFTARALINAAGPWVKAVASLSGTVLDKDLSLVKGSHIIVPKLYDGNHAYFLQNDDKRIVFVIPYHNLHMIGTTDVPFHGHSLDHLEISPEEIDYLLDIVNHYLCTKVRREHIIHSWSGVRPLISQSGKNAQNLSRDYSYSYARSPAPIITILGGKITTYRQLAAVVIDQLKDIFHTMPPSKSKNIALPGAQLNDFSFEKYISYAKEKYSWLDESILHRYLYTYGTLTERFLGPCSSIDSMGTHFGSGLYKVEVDYLIREEWAKTSDDILWRRTKLALSTSPETKLLLNHYLG